MKIVCLLLYFFIASFLAQAQCPSGDLSFSEQAQVDAFKIAYPNCKAISGGINIGFNVENLNGLSNLISVEGGISIGPNYYLKNIDALENLTYIGGTFSLYQCNYINNLHGLRNLTFVGGISITNIGLYNLKGLENITSLPRGLVLEGNSLTSLQGIENVVNAKYFYIRRNNNLLDCVIAPVCNFFFSTHPPESGEYMYIVGNGNCTNSQLALACDALPVTLVSFETKREDKIVNLKWETSSEINSKLFEVQHSTNGKSWNTIGSVKATGEYLANNAYTFQHTNPDPANNYYRLKMIDADDSFAYSSMSHLYFESALVAEVYPNPVADILKIEVADWESISKVELINSNRSVIYQAKTIPMKTIDVSQVESGMHFLKITRKNQSESTYKVVIAR